VQDLGSALERASVRVMTISPKRRREAAGLHEESRAGCPAQDLRPGVLISPSTITNWLWETP